MKRVLLVLAVLALCLPMVGEGQSIEYKSPGGVSELTSSGTALTSTVPLVLPGGYAGLAGAPYVNRQYDAVAVVSTTITAALAAITDATFSKRYLLYVPDGTYSEAVTAKQYVDIVGQSRTGTIVTSASADTVSLGGKNMMLANMTVTQTAGNFYAIHCDGLVDTTYTPASSTTIVYNVSATTTAKAGIGIGLSANQRLILIDSAFTSLDAFGGVYVHNQVAPQTAPFEMTMLNVTATGKYGLDVNPIGSGQPDLVMVVGGKLTGTTADVRTANSGAGAGEIYVSLSSSTDFTTSSYVDASKILSLPAAMASLPLPDQFRYREYFQGLNQSAGISIGSTGTITKNAHLLLQPTTLTSYTTYSANNNGGTARFGMQDSAGTGVFTGGTAYAAIFGTAATYPLEFFQNNVRRVRFDHAGAGFDPGIGFPLVADATVQFGQVVMADAGTDGRFDVNGAAPGTAAIGVFQGNYLGVSQSTAGTNYTIVSDGLARVAMAEDQAVTRGHYLVQSATAGYCDDSATIGTIGLQIGKALYNEAVTATINPTGCTGGAGCINTALNTPNSGPAGQITLGVDVAALGWAVNDPVIYWNSGGTTPTGLTDGKVYFLKTVSTTNVTISTTAGGSVVVPTTQGDDGTQYLQRLPKAVVNIQ